MVSEHRFAFIVLKSVFALVLHRFQRQIYTQIRIQKGQGGSITRAERFKKRFKRIADASIVLLPSELVWGELQLPLMGNFACVGCSKKF